MSLRGCQVEDATDELLSWEAVEYDSGETHVVPLNDLKPHFVDGHCWCGAEDDGGGVWVHNSMDGREAYEEGVRKVS